MWQRAFTHTITATKNNRAYAFTMVGADPFSGGGATTVVGAPVIPIILHFNSDGSNFDPTKPTTCSSGHNIDEAFLHSPMLTADPNPFYMNGVNVGATQYGDATERAEFWSLVGSSNYHTLLSASERVAIQVTVGTSAGFTAHMGCTGLIGLIEINSWDNFLQSALIPFLKQYYGVTAAQFPILLLSNVYWYISNPNNCCVLGYHNAFGSPIQTYSPTTFDTSGVFGASAEDAAVPSHEINEWINDPYGNNPTPAWGGIGQVHSCQSNLEVGDPLTGTQVPSVLMPNGYLYHLQEEAFVSWFFNAQTTPSLGAGGKFSNNGTFHGPARVCPPGGTF